MAQKEEDIANVCPVYEATGKCNDGWRCRFLSGHLVQATDEEGGIGGYKVVINDEVITHDSMLILQKAAQTPHEELNRISFDQQKLLRHDRIPTPLSDAYLRTLVDEEGPIKEATAKQSTGTQSGENDAVSTVESTQAEIQDSRANYIESPLRPTEKRKVALFLCMLI